MVALFNGYNIFDELGHNFSGVGAYTAIIASCVLVPFSIYSNYGLWKGIINIERIVKDEDKKLVWSRFYGRHGFKEVFQGFGLVHLIWPNSLKKISF